MTLLLPSTTQPTPLFTLRGRRDHPAIIGASETITYEQLDERVEGMAAMLGDERRLVAIEAANTIQAVVVYLAALRGGHPVLLVPRATARAAHALLDAWDPDVVVAETHGWVPHPRRSGTAHELHEDLALLMSTSGSTGSPKLVRLSRGNLEANAVAIAQFLRIGPSDRAITTLPMQYCYGLSVINSHLQAGASLVLTDLSVVDRCFWDQFRKAGATSLAGVPHTFDLLDRVGFDTMSLPTLRYVTQAGGRMAPEKVRQYAEIGERDGWELFVMYGQTEATARMAYLPPALASSHPQTIGMPIPGGTLSIDAPDASGVGELVYRGPNVMLGYAERLGDLALGSTVEELRTGDLARRTAEGLYEITGRSARFIKPYGLRIDLDRLEGRLADTGIAAACTGDDERLVVALENPDRAVELPDLLRECPSLPRSHVSVICLEELPRLGSGKPDYAALRELASAPGPASAPEVRGDGAVDLCLMICASYTQALGVEASEDDTFVGLGGDSLSYVEVSIRLEDLLGTLPHGWHLRRIADLVPERRPRRVLASVDTSALMRAIAIVLIVSTHVGLWSLKGGAHTLLAVAGYNLARFHHDARSVTTTILRIAVPSMVWIGLVAAISDSYGWPNVLLINGIVERAQDHWGYWFIEALVQILIPIALLNTIPAVRRLQASRPMALPLAVVVAGLMVRFDLVELSTTREPARSYEIFWLFALGWAAARSTTWTHRLLVSALASVAIPGYFGDTGREVIVLAGTLLLIWVPTLRVPRVIQRVTAPIAAASLYIYLTHFQIYPPLDRLHGPVVATVGSLAVGAGAWLVAGRAADAAKRAMHDRLGGRSSARGEGGPPQAMRRRRSPAASAMEHGRLTSV